MSDYDDRAKRSTLDASATTVNGREPGKYATTARAWVKATSERWPVTIRVVMWLLLFLVAGALPLWAFHTPQGSLATFFILASIVMFVRVSSVIDASTWNRIRWLTNTVQWHTKRLDQLQRRDQSLTETEREPVTESAWPWGNHHTEMLGHLDAAARKWWALYDPTCPDTAPTNEMVATWLSEERAVSKDKARAIASILRADGLRTGPRR